MRKPKKKLKLKTKRGAVKRFRLTAGFSIPLIAAFLTLWLVRAKEEGVRPDGRMSLTHFTGTCPGTRAVPASAPTLAAWTWNFWSGSWPTPASLPTGLARSGSGPPRARAATAT